ncbi:ATP-binding protein [uncultured Weissella sp.]|uniref:ATP-binding protein n=1 Tax=Weissella viridescens TaxID=1629 RepID=UPI0027DCF26C|nr:ATP-binding protein [uncultured Weissella sp.]
MGDEFKTIKFSHEDKVRMAKILVRQTGTTFEDAYAKISGERPLSEEERLEKERQFSIRAQERLDTSRVLSFYNSSLWAQGRKKTFTFGDWNPNMQTNIEQAKAIGNKAFSLAKELEHRDFNVLLTGSVGAGKTALALAISDKLRSSKTTLFVSMVEWKNLRMNAIKSPEKQREFSKLEQLMKDAEVLILDDLGKDNKDSNGRATQDTNNMLFGLGDARMGKTTIITTNDSQSDLARKYDEAVVSRLITKNPDHTISTNGLKDVREV